MIRIFISFLISGVLLYFTLRQIDVQEAINLLKETNLFLVVLAVLVHFVGYVGRSIRWSVLLSKIKVISFKELFPIINIGYMANNVLPFRIGELVRLQLTYQEFGISRSTAASTVILERLMDGLTLLIFLFLFITFSDVPDEYRTSAFLFGVLLISALVSFVVMLYLRQNQRAKNLILRIPFINFPPVKETIKSFIVGLEPLKDFRIIYGAASFSVLIWLIESLMTYLVAESMGLSVNYLQIIFLTAVINLSTIIPSAPGYFGTFEFFTFHALSLFGVGKTEAVTFAALAHFLQWAPVTVVGFLYTFKYHVSFKSLTAKTTQSL